MALSSVLEQNRCAVFWHSARQWRGLASATCPVDVPLQSERIVMKCWENVTLRMVKIFKNYLSKFRGQSNSLEQLS